MDGRQQQCPLRIWCLVLRRCSVVRGREDKFIISSLCSASLSPSTSPSSSLGLLTLLSLTQDLLLSGSQLIKTCGLTLKRSHCPSSWRKTLFLCRMGHGKWTGSWHCWKHGQCVALCSNCCSCEQGIMCFREDEGLDSVLTLKSIPAPHTDLRL